MWVRHGLLLRFHSIVEHVEVDVYLRGYIMLHMYVYYVRIPDHGNAH